LPGYDRSKLAQWARELGFVRDTLEKVLRLSDVLWKYWIFRRFGNGGKNGRNRKITFCPLDSQTFMRDSSIYVLNIEVKSC